MKLARRSFLSAMAKGAGALALVMSYPSALFAKWHKEAFLSTKLDEAIMCQLTAVRQKVLKNQKGFRRDDRAGFIINLTKYQGCLRSKHIST